MKSVKEATEKLQELGFEVYMSRGKYNLGACGKAAELFPGIVEWTDLDPRSDYGRWQLKINGQEIQLYGFTAQELKSAAQDIVQILGDPQVKYKKLCAELENLVGSNKFKKVVELVKELEDIRLKIEGKIVF